MRISIVGAGRFGSSLGRVLASKGYHVTFCVRRPEKCQELPQSIRGSAVAAISAARDADVIMLAVPWDQAENAVRSLGALSGKILVDCTNPISMEGLLVGHSTSAAEEIARWASGARVVKGFNTIGSEALADPHYGQDVANTFVASDDAEAKKTVSSIASSLGFEVVDCGPLENARLIEPLALLWIRLALAQGYGPDIAIKLLKK